MIADTPERLSALRGVADDLRATGHIATIELHEVDDRGGAAISVEVER